MQLPAVSGGGSPAGGFPRGSGGRSRGRAAGPSGAAHTVHPVSVPITMVGMSERWASTCRRQSVALGVPSLLICMEPRANTPDCYHGRDHQSTLTITLVRIPCQTLTAHPKT